MNLDKYNYTLDTCHLLCPGPIIETKKQLNIISIGETILVITKDESFKIDFMVLANVKGHKMLQSWQEHDKFFYVIQK